MSRIKRNDNVKVIAGRERGRSGKVLSVNREKSTAVVERLNFVKRHTRAGGSAGQQGGIIEKEAPMALSKLMVVCPKCSKAARLGITTLEDGSRVRYCKKCNEQIDS